MQIHSIIDPRIESGIVQGQMMFWDGTRWVHTEVSELFWDDKAKRFTARGIIVTGGSVLGLNSVVFQPNANSTTFLQIKNAAGTQVVGVDTTNGRMIIGTIEPGRALQVGTSGSWSNTSGILVKGSNPGIELADTQDTPQRWVISNGVIAVNDGLFGIYDATVGAYRMVISPSTGHVVIGGTSAKTRLTLEGTLTLKERASADGDTAAYGQIWVKNTTPNELMFTDDVGSDMLIAPLAYGEISVVSNAVETAIASQNVYVQVTIFDTNGENFKTTPDHTNDHLTITKAGRYFISCSITLNSIGGSGSTAEMEVKKNNGASRVGSLHVDRTLSGGGTESGAITITGIANLAVDDTIEVWLKNETNTQNYVVEDITLSLMQIGG